MTPGHRGASDPWELHEKVRCANPGDKRVSDVEVERPVVQRLCERCYTREATWLRSEQIVSPQGVAHIGQDGGTTACGIDATGDNWWWPL